MSDTEKELENKVDVLTKALIEPPKEEAFREPIEESIEEPIKRTIAQLVKSIENFL